MLWEQHGILISNRNRIKNGLNIQKLLDAILLHAALAIIKTSRNSKLNSLEAKGNNLADTSSMNAFKGTKDSQNSVMVHRHISPNDNWVVKLKN